jgi:K+-sensing histidine kinase KdpD
MIYVAKEKGINIVIDSNIEQESLQADKVQLKRVIMNLLSNGIKYAYKNSNLKIRLKSNRQKIEFEFENYSPYIPKEKQQAIFAQYVSYAETHKEIGIGLGLYASKKIIEAHQGKIYVKSFKNERNVFGFSIPSKKAL